jgi:polyhydroxyalkanoate synthesis regulator phasin
MELAERITSRVTELTSEVELLRKQLADAEHELDRGGDSRAGHHPADGR